MPIDLPSMRKNSKDCMSAWEKYTNRVDLVELVEL
jgi:hypothetical protein